MKIIIALLIFASIVAADFYRKGQKSLTMSPPSYHGGPLPACSSKPNCVSSEHPDTGSFLHYIEPIKVYGSDADILEKATLVIEQMGGRVTMKGNDFFTATFTSRLFNFVDDIQMRIHDGELHFRSASRVGLSDFNANRARMNDFTQRFGHSSHIE